MTPKLPGLLVRYIQQKRCVAFVGAGLSAGAGLPTWGRLLLKGIDELVVSIPEGEGHQEELRNLVERGKLLEVADFCKEKLGAAYHQFLTDQIRGDQAELPGTHDVLMHLPFSAWVTTNYDKLLERAYSKVKGGFPKTLTHKDTDALGRLLFDGGQFILKAHGDIDRPETVVLTSRDYSEIIHANPAFNEVFSGLLLTKALLFVGYSLSDPDFRLLMDRQLTHFKGFVPERYALMSGVGPVERDVLWRTARIQVIPYVNESGSHAEVLHFLEALKAATLSESPPGGAQAKLSIPAPASAPPQPAGIRPHNVAGAPRMGPPRSGARGNLEVRSAPMPASERTPTGASAAGEGAGYPLEQEESLPFGALPAEPPPPPPRAPEAQPVPTAPHRLLIEPAAGRIQLRLLGGDAMPVAQGIAPTRLNEDVRLSLTRAVEAGSKSHAWLYTHLMELFAEYLPREVLDALGRQGASPQPPLVLCPTPELARFPWELLPLQGAPVCLKRRLVRAPVGVSVQVRGAPQVRASPRILLVEGRGGADGGGARELERLARLYEGAPGLSCKVLMGADATFAHVMAELDDALPDLFHYTGDIGQLDGELYLNLPGDMDLSLGALRSVLSRGRLPFLVMNAPSSAFAPYAFGVSPVKGGYQRLSVPNSRAAIFEGREGFMGLATQMGVGAFVGAFDRPGARASAGFMVALHRALLTGLPAADAVRAAREETWTPDDPTALQYVLSGDGDLQLWDSRRAEGVE
ncbi:MAG: SIR2 family protein [Myxococcaceae bacterium]|nr:SIR2 family protein [Myxococcaceae bacterium]